MRYATDTFRDKRSNGIQGVPFEEWRQRASDLKISVLENLSGYGDQFASNATRRGAIVHRAVDAAHARELVGDILHDHDANKRGQGQIYDHRRDSFKQIPR